MTQATSPETPALDFALHGRRVVELQSQAVAALAERIDHHFEKACEIILGTEGRVVVVGMGKSGHIGGKIASTLASTGTPAFFVHPGEASHGDLGMITPADTVIGISNSGETPEMLTILPIVKRMNVGLIALCGRVDSTLGRLADVCLDISVNGEACPLNLAPTASTAATLAMGDALAIAVLNARNFTQDDFARSHPGGALGRRLLLYVRDVMQTGDRVPLVSENSALQDALMEISTKSMGMTGVVDAQRRLVGIFTDGDLRRTLNSATDIYHCGIGEVMTVAPKTVHPDTLAVEVVRIMRDHSINGIFVVDDNGEILGALNMHDLFRTGII